MKMTLKEVRLELIALPRKIVVREDADGTYEVNYLGANMMRGLRTAYFTTDLADAYDRGLAMGNSTEAR